MKTAEPDTEPLHRKVGYQKSCLFCYSGLCKAAGLQLGRGAGQVDLLLGWKGKVHARYIPATIVVPPVAPFMVVQLPRSFPSVCFLFPKLLPTNVAETIQTEHFAKWTLLRLPPSHVHCTKHCHRLPTIHSVYLKRVMIWVAPGCKIHQLLHS
jgi:hypothetical protein